MSRKTALIGSAALLVVLAGVGLWYFLLRSDAPPPVALEDAVGQVGGGTSTSVAPGNTVADTTQPPRLDSLDGEWVVDTTTSFVGYRVNEELASIGFNEVVGRTSEVVASFTLQGATVTSVDVAVDMTALTTDDGFRDEAMRAQGLESDVFPTASFTLAEPMDLGSVPEPETAITAGAVGDLTLHGVTRRVTIPVEAQLVDSTVVVVGSLPVQFADYEIQRPRAAVVLSVEDNGIFEFQLAFTKG